MRIDSDPFQPTRRQFAVAFGAAFVVASSGGVAHARGGGGDNIRERQQREQSRAHGFTQQEFLGMSRTKFFEHSSNPNAVVDGFSRKMSNSLFKMGVANLPRTKALVLKLQDIRKPQQRLSALQDEMKYAQGEVDGFWGLSSQRKKREIYAKHVAIWVANPREGILNVLYSG